MSDIWRKAELPEIVRTLAKRPRHEMLRSLIVRILRSGFDVPYSAIGNEVFLLEGRGRIDTMFGATVIELKTDLRRELAAAEGRLPDYLKDTEKRTRLPATGIVTDGALFIAYQLRGGQLAEISKYQTDSDNPDALLEWLEPALSDRDDLPPVPIIMQRELGRTSLTFGIARTELSALWAAHGDDPEVKLKRQLWDGLLREAYGEPVGSDALFLQHTYLTVVVKAIAARVLDLPISDPHVLLNGQALRDEGINGAVESDFFDWVLKDPAGQHLVRRIAREASRFRLHDLEADVLKALYESLVDPEQRHDLGEYYTPDWLAAKLVATAIESPLEALVLDPACGSGTFLFHTIRRLIAAGRAAGWSDTRIVEVCSN